MADEFEDEANPGTTAVYSADESSSTGDLTADLRATITDDDAPSSSFPGQQGSVELPQFQQDNASSGREGQADTGGGFIPPPVPSAISAREIMASMGMPVEHYPDDRAAMTDLLTNVYQSQQQLQQAARQVQALQQHAQMLQQQRAQPSAPQPTQEAPSRPQWSPEFADIQIIDSENGEKRYVRKSTGLPVAPEIVQKAIEYSQSRDEFLRDLYEKPEQAMAPIVSEAVQQAMQQFQQYQQQQTRQAEYQQNLQQANDYVVKTFGDTLFQPGPYGPNLQQPTPLGYQFLQILEQLPQSIPPTQKVQFASDRLAVQIMQARPQLFSQLLNGQQQMPQQQFAPQQQVSPGEQQRQQLRRTAYRNPSVSSPSANGTADAFFEDPGVDIREKLRQAMLIN